MSGDVAATYDEIPYPGVALPETHPAHLSTLGWLFGQEPADPETARVLEIGCAAGANLVPMAAQYPRAEFLGIDVSGQQIGAAQHYAQALGVTNATFRTMDLADLGDADGQFDYVIAYGVFSWIDAEHRQALLRLCGERLSERGLAFVSYNTLPGWYNRRSTMDLMRMAAENAPTGAEGIRRARAALELLKAALEEDYSPHEPRRSFRAGRLTDVERLLGTPDGYLVHEFLSPTNEPMFFRDFMAGAHAAGLTYIADAVLASMYPGRFPLHVGMRIADTSRDRLDYEQLMDMLVDRTFRLTILAREAAARPVAFAQERLARCWFRLTGAFEPGDATDVLHGSNGSAIRLADGPLRAAARRLAAEEPAAVHFSDFEGERRAVEAGLFMLLSNGAATVSRYADGWTPRPAARPVALKAARVAAANRLPVVSGRHKAVPLDGFQAAVLELLDGTRTIDDLVRDVRPIIPPEVEQPSDAELRAGIAGAVGHLARHAVLVA